MVLSRFMSSTYCRRNITSRSVPFGQKISSVCNFIGNKI